MTANRLPMHGRNHRPGGSDPIPGLHPVDFGATTQEPFLPAFQSTSNCDINGSVRWVGDAASYGGGYMTSSAPADGDYFSFLTLFSPKGSAWALRYLYYVGPNYGKIEVELASVGYELESRLPNGCPQGKIQDAFPSYGPDLVYLSLFTGTQDGYDTVEAQGNHSGDVQLIVGGNVGDPLTDLTHNNNPCAGPSVNYEDEQSGFSIMDGGPGWYRTRFRITGKNASSSGYQFRISRIGWYRVDDFGAV